MCASHTPVNRELVCRLCHCQLKQLRRQFGKHRVDLDMVRDTGQQLMLANMHKARFRPATPVTPIASTRLVWPDRPVRHQQLILVDVTPDLRPGRGVTPPPRDPVLAAALDAHVTDAAARNHWRWGYTTTVRSAVRILLGLQHTPGAAITATEIDVLRQVRLPMRSVTDLLAEVDMFHDDRIPTVQNWFQQRIHDLPTAMRDELTTWFDIMINGSTSPPRRRPRTDTTVELYTAWALPALTAWADHGHSSLREISRSDLLTVLPPSGQPRAQTARALRSIFEILKARRQVFIDPTARLSTWVPASQPPMPADVGDIAAALNSPDVARAALVALAAFHGLNAGQIRQLRLTDIRDRKLHIADRTIPLAEPVRTRIDAYLAHRHHKWPNATNTHLFINLRTAQRSEPVGYRWLRLNIDYPGGIAQLRQDRILHEAIATGGDTRKLCDLFGLSISAASRYTNTLGHPDLRGSPTTTNNQT